MRHLLPLLAFAACATKSPMTTTSSAPPLDPHSHAQPDRVRTQHLDLDLTIAMHEAGGGSVHGRATHTIERLDPSAPFIVDWKALTLGSVTDQAGRPLTATFGPPDENLGMALSIALRPDTAKVVIDYTTTDEGDAIQWLSPEQTNGGTKPFLFTQGQAILTRSWIPLQDSPGIRISWAARVVAPAGLVPVMSAIERGRDGSAFTFSMPKPVPPYLIALACGNLVSRDISGRCAVWAEPKTIDLAASELADMEQMVQACEQLFGPYRWGRYDLLILPPSFPFGGMENPCLTFATPTILAGDKSLVSLVAHELAHSWSGNLVTNATWRDFWLNEGFTVYLETRIMEQVFGKDRATMEVSLGMQSLAAEMKTLPAADQVLHIDLTGRNPDDGMTDVPYQKGAAFLRRLEEVFGRAEVDAFLQRWFDEHAFTSVTTATFVQFLQRDLFTKDPAKAAQIDVAKWISGSGLPGDAPIPTSTLFAAVDTQLAAWRAGKTAGELATKGWVTQQWLRFLAGLGAPAKERLADLDMAFAFTRSGNSEILCAWLGTAVRADYRAVDRRLDLFLMTVGRRKFLKPLYEALLATNGGKERALAIYQRARPRYHAVAQRTLDAMLGYTPR
ncbi:MAG: M1 family metallopeptidase [Planctomycetes bacterium]|nr:M1 family metallopeptidase [Planctomycetota bacterium]